MGYGAVRREAHLVGDGGEDRLGPWSDLYALGATVYHGVTGRAPLAATQRVSAMHDDEPDPVDLRPGDC